MPIYSLTYTLRDAFDRLSTRGAEITALDFPAAQAVQATLMTAVGNLTEAQILKTSLAEILPYTDSVTAGANIDAGLTVVWEIGGVPGKKGNTRIPAPDLSLFDANGVLDLADARVTAYAAPYLAGDILISDGEVVDAILSGRLDR